MDVALQHHKRSIPYATSSSTLNHRPPSAHNATIQSGFAMPLTDLCIKRIVVIPKPIRFNHHHLHHHKLFSVKTSNFKTTPNMADEESNKKRSQLLNGAEKEKNEDKKVEKSTAPVNPPPEPPEKPLPGDCCGSGCVRCVWDVYYEELEEYNKLCNSDLKEKSGK